MNSAQKEMTLKQILKDAESFKDNTQNILNLEKEMNFLEKGRKDLESKYIKVARKVFMRHEMPLGVSDEYAVRLSFNAPSDLSSAESVMDHYAILVDKRIGKSLLEKIQSCEERIEQCKNDIAGLCDENFSLLKSQKDNYHNIDAVVNEAYLDSRYKQKAETVNEYRNSLYLTKCGIELGLDMMAVNLARNIGTLKSNLIDIMESQEKIAMLKEKMTTLDSEYRTGDKDFIYHTIMMDGYEKQTKQQQQKILELEQMNQTLLETYQIDTKDVCTIIDYALEKGSIGGCFAEDLAEYRNLVVPDEQYRETEEQDMVHSGR